MLNRQNGADRHGASRSRGRRAPRRWPRARRRPQGRGLRRRSGSGRTRTARPPSTQVANAWASSSRRRRRRRRQAVRRTSATTSTPCSRATRPTSSSARTTGPASSRPTASSLPLVPKKAVQKQFPTYTLDAFSYGTAVKRLYGVPTQLENVGLVVNTRLVEGAEDAGHDLEKPALAFKKKSAGNLAHRRPAGRGRRRVPHVPVLLGPRRLRLRHEQGRQPRPVEHRRGEQAVPQERDAHRQVEPEGLINSKVDGSTAQNAFLKGQAAFWITGPWNIDTLQEERAQVPDHPAPEDQVRARCRSSASGLHGHEVRRRARRRERSRRTSSPTTWRAPRRRRRSRARTAAIRRTWQPASASTTRRSRQFGRAGNGGVPMPNIPQMGNVWDRARSALGSSRRRASGATPRREPPSRLPLQHPQTRSRRLSQSATSGGRPA